MTAPQSPPMPAFRTRVFLWGADMNPISIRERWPEGRFVGIARATGLLTQGAGLPPEAFGPEVWGIVIETGAPQPGLPLPLTMRDGTSATAMLASAPGHVGAPDAILVEARYWELPQSYRDRIQEVTDGVA